MPNDKHDEGQQQEAETDKPKRRKAKGALKVTDETFAGQAGVPTAPAESQTTK